ncbi:hypothetical protein C7N43_25005 [Sphingobacteriales bacterium UPWRP_1]|nr:hypothetical protein BVG80_17125 [Sphingobacteriales bacterium TSM_CSM]PSJ74221.1 hypothetical protein C7N43_25005 [Sphingobacteriales bacterium UPWRP_1]
MKRKNLKTKPDVLKKTPLPQEQPDIQQTTPATEEYQEDPEYLEILKTYTEADLEALDLDPDEAENRYTGYEMEE